MVNKLYHLMDTKKIVSYDSRISLFLEYVNFILLTPSLSPSEPEPVFDAVELDAFIDGFLSIKSDGVGGLGPKVAVPDYIYCNLYIVILYADKGIFYISDL